MSSRSPSFIPASSTTGLFGGKWEDRPEMKKFGWDVVTDMPEMFHHVLPKATEDKG
ncbi:hypothetical protein K432DRAFT_384009 [Lepidopterella palustris CBS 459.81]|uniref:Uncharacterized protein n=1 Tax=Lepidopterella palustris CBS 459.81 TaxID=1314670 RepID=A0A8E2E6W0_9PEZI|nr:hypothetical protein K432DRAFT_384009 [Lepidopterella palustris CBS 459.81]